MFFPFQTLAHSRIFLRMTTMKYQQYVVDTMETDAIATDTLNVAKCGGWLSWATRRPVERSFCESTSILLGLHKSPRLQSSLDPPSHPPTQTGYALCPLNQLKPAAYYLESDNQSEPPFQRDCPMKLPLSKHSLHLKF